MNKWLKIYALMLLAILISFVIIYKIQVFHRKQKLEVIKATAIQNKLDVTNLKAELCKLKSELP